MTATPTGTLNAWHIAAPPGCRFANISGSDVVLYFPHGAEKAMRDYLVAEADRLLVGPLPRGIHPEAATPAAPLPYPQNMMPKAPQGPTAGPALTPPMPYPQNMLPKPAGPERAAAEAFAAEVAKAHVIPGQHGTLVPSSAAPPPPARAVVPAQVGFSAKDGQCAHVQAMSPTHGARCHGSAGHPGMHFLQDEGIFIPMNMAPPKWWIPLLEETRAPDETTEPSEDAPVFDASATEIPPPASPEIPDVPDTTTNLA